MQDATIAVDVAKSVFEVAVSQRPGKVAEQATVARAVIALLAAFVGDVGRFPSGRHFASYLGLTPRESSSGLQRRLGRISKRGDPYLRMLLIHGARSVLCHAKRAAKPHDWLRTWALERERTRGHNKPQSRSRTSWRASSGPCGAGNAPIVQPRSPATTDPRTD